MGEHGQVPGWVESLPAVNAGLNGLATVLLVAGFAAIKGGRRTVHARCMVASFATSVAFLACYLVYHAALQHFTGSGSRPYPSDAPGRSVYLAILLTHVVLAAAVPVLAGITLWRAWREDWTRHRRIAKITLPIWLYVSVTGVVIYWMLYHFAARA